MIMFIFIVKRLWILVFSFLKQVCTGLQGPFYMYHQRNTFHYFWIVLMEINTVNLPVGLGYRGLSHQAI